MNEIHAAISFIDGSIYTLNNLHLFSFNISPLAAEMNGLDPGHYAKRCKKQYTTIL